jgi:cytochrome c
MIRIRHLVVAASAFGAVLATADALASSQLAAKGGCGACHMAERKLVGPSYKDIAAKYKDRPDAVAYLSQRVRKGGPGNWGSVPMAPTDLSKLNDAEMKTVVGWILATPQ